MDAFERARAKHAKNLERRTRLDVVATESPKISIEEPLQEAPRKSLSDAVIEVMVTLPSGSFEVRLVKTDVLANIPRKLTKLDFENCLRSGLRPLLGELKG